MRKREYILDIAEELFSNFGYTAVGVDLIRDEAKVSKTSMYRYFGSKNKLIEAVLARRHQRFVDELNEALAKTDSAEERLQAILTWHFAWFQHKSFKGCLFMHAFAEFKGIDAAIAAHAVQHKAWMKSLIMSVFNQDQQASASKAEAIMTFLEGMIIRAEFGNIKEDEEAYRSGARALAFNN